ncbi:Spc19p [Cyberlindnera jadinii NRRL Y-1542]|uniref:DASH complex subunit SPC19 n=1 Tax=Cyberlindnera jadinii (strain ATCC 18201 / CBS 1600 / BCRC 20928 / JCM 3617 / NBRC 0987 / NRRL Y-1542) TaxID=983966 RepID=A0A1E4S4S8_CYBJN|nr:DASH complex, subunit Spc19 [Cyberlindnera jadinii NRRL Y-1542]ODV74495.1 DASH complex, subunit Spc19 [Cyberlindnera jadinii NRRL Y-1542]
MASYPMESTLKGCVTSLSSCVSLLSESLSSLDSQVDDFQRLTTILDQSRIFTLVPETDVLMAKKSLSEEVEPRIMALMERSKLKLSKLERKNANLQSKRQLNDIRISKFKSEEVSIQGTPEELEQLRQLRLKKDRLKYKLSSINLKQRKQSFLINSKN